MTTRRSIAVAVAIAFSSVTPACPQAIDPPKPIPEPPIPPPASFTPAPSVTFGADAGPARPKIIFPESPALSPIVIPPPAPMTAVAPSERLPGPQSAALSVPPPVVSPGSSPSAIQELKFIVDPASSQIPASAAMTLRDVAQALARNPAARIEIRAFSPTKTPSQSNARRLSLARFLAVRDFLLKEGVDDNRIDGRALISGPNELNADRIELYIEN